MLVAFGFKGDPCITALLLYLNVSFNDLNDMGLHSEFLIYYKQYKNKIPLEELSCNRHQKFPLTFRCTKLKTYVIKCLLKARANRRVQFPVHNVVSHVYEIPRNEESQECQTYQLDKIRFAHRIKAISEILNPILNSRFRKAIHIHSSHAFYYSKHE